MAADWLDNSSAARPATVAEACDLVREARSQGRGVVPVGGRTALDLGRSPSKPVTLIDTRGLDRVIDFPARDMTVTVEAGITLAKLADLLRPENLRLPIDVPLPERATLGGAVAANLSGPRRFGHGTFRDAVIGIGYVTDHGESAKAGGRVVKNVAGYDLMKLHTGALGTLGVITHLTLKLKPGSDLFRFAVLPAPEIERAALLRRVMASRTRPVVIDYVGGRTAGELGLGTREAFLVGFEGVPAAVEWQLDQLSREFTSLKPEALDAEASERLLPRLRDWRAAGDGGCRLKVNTVADGVFPVIDAGKSWATREGAEVVARAHAGSGICYILPLGLKDAGQLRSLMGALAPVAAAYHGNGVLDRRPAAWAAELPLYLRPPADAALCRTVKRGLDPDNLFSPGRWIDADEVVRP